MKQREVNCPTCKKKFNYFESEFRPFCCEKCRLIDLGQWLSESYAVPAEKLTPDEMDTLEKLQNEENRQEDDQEDDSLQ
jgi:endogenous inhibitor of DNA gyrase (YacG/DUF329 family)